MLCYILLYYTLIYYSTSFASIKHPNDGPIIIADAPELRGNCSSNKLN